MTPAPTRGHAGRHEYRSRAPRTPDNRRRRRHRRHEGLRHRRRRGPRPRRRDRLVRDRQVHGDHGPVRIRQVDAAALPRRPRRTDIGRDLRRRHLSGRARRQAAHRAPPHQDRLRLPGVQPDPDAHRRREHPPADDARRRDRRRRVDRPGHHHGRTRRPAAPPPERALRRAAATGRRGASARRHAPTSSSPTSRPATSTPPPAPRSSTSCGVRFASSARPS